MRDGLYRPARRRRSRSIRRTTCSSKISLWVAQGFDPVAIKTWAGDARTSMTSDVYSHVIVDPDGDEWREFWATIYAAERRPRVVPVWSQEVKTGRDRAS